MHTYLRHMILTIRSMSLKLRMEYLNWQRGRTHMPEPITRHMYDAAINLAVVTVWADKSFSPEFFGLIQALQGIHPLDIGVELSKIEHLLLAEQLAAYDR